jgi:stearoyl-CoA desaturase (delta-9 desaturase)
MYGYKPYDRTINPVENLLVTIGAIGEGFHNYHHTFPQDYSTSEFGWRLNPTTLFLDGMAKIGQVSDRKSINPDLVKKRMLRTGDGSKGGFGLIKN